MRRTSDSGLVKSQTRIAVSHKFRSGFAFLLSFLFLSGCATADKPVAEAPPPPTTAASANSPAASAANQPQPVANNLPPPELKTVEDAVKRVFKDAALVDATHQPAFVAGDFNGDLSQDLVVVIKPAADKISEMNEEFPRWILRDPLSSAELKTARLSVAANDKLLAIIHGYGPNGWRDPEATQTYLLKNAAGSGMQTRQAKELAAANRGKKLPRLRGDVVGEVIEGKAGFLYFAGATYAWYDPKTFKGEVVERSMVHGAAKK